MCVCVGGEDRGGIMWWLPVECASFVFKTMMWAQAALRGGTAGQPRRICYGAARTLAEVYFWARLNRMVHSQGLENASKAENSPSRVGNWCDFTLRARTLWGGVECGKYLATITCPKYEKSKRRILKTHTATLLSDYPRRVRSLWVSNSGCALLKFRF